MLEQLRRLLSRLTLRQKATLAIAAAGVSAGLWGFVHWSHERGFEPLYTGLAPDDASAVVERLRSSGVEYRLSDGGATVKVTSAQAAEARLLVAGAGLPKTGRLGFELFDTTNFGLTEFAEQVNYRRAIEGELERSIMAIHEIERARVHISLAKDSVFLEGREEAKASVLVKLRPRADLSPQNGAAICHLVAAAVNRLSPRNVTVIDTEGRLLVKPQRELPDGAADGLIEYRQQLERDLLQKIHRTIEPLVGVENYRAGVSVECDLETREESEETFDPGKAAVQNTQKTEDIAGGPLASGQPGTASNLPRAPLRTPAGGAGLSRKTENTTYQTSRTVVHTKVPQGVIRRISVAVLLGHTARTAGSGAQSRRVMEPPDAKRIETIRALVAAATGISKDRGDTLAVETLPFEPRADAPAFGEPPPASRPGWIEWVERLPLPVRIGAGVAAVLIALAPVAWLALRRKKPPAAAVAQTALPATEAGADVKSIEQAVAEREAERQRRDAETLSQLALPPLETPRGELLAKLIRDGARNDPAATARLIESWINERD